MKAEDILKADWHWRAALGNPGEMLVVPSNHAYTVTCDEGILLRWGWGCTDKEECKDVLTCVTELVNTWPELHTEEYEAWMAWLKEVKK